ncbi:MAG: type II secretion system protein [Alphaproteobacteria bacterium]
MHSNNALKKTTRLEKGFTLIEIAVVVMIIGLITAPILGVYHLHQVKKQIEKTEKSLSRSVDAIVGFKSLFGRYPCPAPLNAVPGDIEYGYEDCSGGAGVIIAESENTTLANRNVQIGSIPFRTINITEGSTFDGYGSRLTYAVTEILTDDTTYEDALGGVTLIDENDESVITPENSAHFAVITHGEQNAGAISANGVQIGMCSQAPINDQANCDYLVSPNSIFRVSGLSVDSDDRVSYSSSVGLSPWQYQAGNTTNIHLRRADSVIYGESNLINTALGTVDTGTLDLRNISTDGDGTLTVQESVDASGVIDPNTGAVVTGNLCNSAGNCFNPILIGGEAGDPLPGPITPNDPFAGAWYGDTTIANASVANPGGLICPQGVMIGIRDSRPVCSDTLTFACPAGQFISGINGQRIVCSTAPEPGCTAESVVTMCGDNQVLNSTNHGGLSPVFSGECHQFAPGETFSAAYANSLMVPGDFVTSRANLVEYITTLNNQTRTSSPCQLIREVYECNAGTFSPRFQRERGPATNTGAGAAWPAIGAGTNYPSGTSHPSHVNFNPASPMAVDPNNNNAHHDCWCREDYRVVNINCSGSFSGQRLRVERHSCPQTHTSSSRWVNIWTSENDICSGGCSESIGDVFVLRTCASHFGVSSDRVQGNVLQTCDRTCPDGATTCHSIDTSQCRCPNRSPQIPDPHPVRCGTGFNNSWNFNGAVYTNVRRATHNTWFCPTGPGGPVTSAAQAGYWVPETREQACICDSTATSSITSSCPSNFTGSVIRETRLNCTTGNFEETGVVDTSGCIPCRWTATGIPDIPNSATNTAPNARNAVCNCSTTYTDRRCSEPTGTGFNIWNACSCQP